jgi:SHS family lactate transporter-like MFS transporter
MGAFSQLKSLNREQRAAFIAALLGWTLDAFDFFLMVFMFKAIAKDFATTVKQVEFAVMLTLMFRPVGALLFGWLGDKYGRRRILMVDVLMYSSLELASAFAPTLTSLLVIRALFGIAMGGEWGLGSSLVMETIPASARGVVSGILQEGYALGYLLASVVFGLLFDHIGWRGMFMVGVAPALLVVYLRFSVKESAGWEKLKSKPVRITMGQSVRQNWKLMVYTICLMTAFNFFSHGTQDLFPTYQTIQHKFNAHTVSFITIIANFGALTGGIFFGSLSQKLGRRRAIIMASLCVLPALPVWAGAVSWSPIILAIGAFFVQAAVQGAWGVIPAHLNELSPPEIRGTFPGFTYQIGNLIASTNLLIQNNLVEHFNGNYGLAMALVAGTTALVICILAGLGKEAREAVLVEA